MSALTNESIGICAGQVRLQGYSVLPIRLSPELVDALLEGFLRLLQETAARESCNRGANRYQIYLPWEEPFADPRLYANDFVLGVLEEVLGPDPALVYFASDTPLPGSVCQRVHADTRVLFPETSLLVPAYGLVLNVPLVDCTEENGSLEFWPGTHLPARPDDLESAAGTLESRRANLPAGSLLIRDLRMWHRGTPNRSSQPRPHLAMVYTRPWYRFEQRVPALRRSAFERLDDLGRRLLRYAAITD